METDKFKLTQTSKIFSDETAKYKVELKYKMTLNDFINAVLENTMEWGDIYIYYQNEIIGECKYRYGKLIGFGKNNFTEEQLNSIISEVTSRGGWTQMHYWVKFN